MTFFEIEIKALNKQEEYIRTIEIAKSQSWNDLHLTIQLIFNLDIKEYFEFEYSGMKYKPFPNDVNEYSSEGLLCNLQVQDHFYYEYDLLKMEKFELTIRRIFEKEDCFIRLIDGNKNYWNEYPYLKNMSESKFSYDWINEQLKFLSVQPSIVETFQQRFTQAMKRLNKISHWQDYLHGLIVCLQFPCSQSVFIGAEASGNQVYIDLYFHQESFVKYLLCDHRLARKHLRKYQQQIQITITSITMKKATYQVYYQGSNHESWYFRGYLGKMLEAVERFVKLIENLVEFHQNDSTNPFYLIDPNGNIYHDLKLLRKQEVNEEENLEFEAVVPLSGEVIDVMVDCIMGEEGYEFLYAEKQSLKRMKLQRLTIHSIQVQLHALLLSYIKKGNRCVVHVRDPWMKKIAQPICEMLQFELNIHHTLDYIDERIKDEPVDIGFVKVPLIDVLEGKSLINTSLTYKTLN